MVLGPMSYVICVYFWFSGLSGKKLFLLKPTYISESRGWNTWIPDTRSLVPCNTATATPLLVGDPALKASAIFHTTFPTFGYFCNLKLTRIIWHQSSSRRVSSARGGWKSPWARAFSSGFLHRLQANNNNYIIMTEEEGKAKQNNVTYLVLAQIMSNAPVLSTAMLRNKR